MTLQTKVVASPDQISCDIRGETAVLNVKTGIYYCLNPIGTRIWSMVQAPTRVFEIRDSLLREYEVDVSRCERNLLDVLTALSAAQLVNICADGSA